MSIWTELMFLHGHVATPLALGLVAGTCARPTAVGASTRPDPRSSSAPDASSVPATGHVPPAGHDQPAGHALRTVGQLR